MREGHCRSLDSSDEWRIDDGGMTVNMKRVSSRSYFVVAFIAVRPGSDNLLLCCHLWSNAIKSAVQPVPNNSLIMNLP